MEGGRALATLAAQSGQDWHLVADVHGFFTRRHGTGMRSGRSQSTMTHSRRSTSRKVCDAIVAQVFLMLSGWCCARVFSPQTIACLRGSRALCSCRRRGRVMDWVGRLP